MAKLGTKWTDTELRACVDEYASAVKAGGLHTFIEKDSYLTSALKNGLEDRGAGAVGRRMSNISAVLDEKGKPYVLGWKPLRNVGSGVTKRLQRMLQDHGLV
jgi:5-methylcytosine-specific restriction protein A